MKQLLRIISYNNSENEEDPQRFSINVTHEMELTHY